MRYLALALLVLAASGCSLFTRVADDAATGAVNGAERREVQNEQDKAAADSAARAQQQQQLQAQQQTAANAQLSAAGPMMAQAYSRMIFAFAFSPGAMAPGAVYKPGEYTRWSIAERGSTFERGYLFNDASGNGWWKFKLDPGGPNKTVIYEALVNPDHTKCLRLRARMPGDTAVQELPVDDSAMAMSSGGGARGQAEDKGMEQVSVPAGSFNAHHLRYADAQGRGSADTWQADSVPGKTVRVTATGANGHGVDMQLLAFGSDAKSELGTTP